MAKSASLAAQLAPELHVVVLEILAANVGPDDLRANIDNFSSVCRLWHSIMQRLLYKSVELKTWHSALCFLRTLDDTDLGIFVNAVSIGSMVYLDEQVFRLPSPPTGVSVPNDRLLNTIVRNCPNLEALSLASLYFKVNSGFREGAFSRPARNVFSHIRRLHIDAGMFGGASPHWLARAISAGELDFPHLETLVWYGGNGTSDKWTTFPSLRKLHVHGGALQMPSAAAFNALLSIACPPRLEQVFFAEVKGSGPITARQLRRLSHLRVLDIGFRCDIDPLDLANLVQLNAHCLEKLRLKSRSVTMSDGGHVVFPYFQRLRSLDVSWDIHSTFVVPPVVRSLVLAAARALRELELIWVEVGQTFYLPSTPAEEFHELLAPVVSNIESLTIMDNRQTEMPQFHLFCLRPVFSDMLNLRSLTFGCDSNSTMLGTLDYLPPNLQTLNIYVHSWKAKPFPGTHPPRRLEMSTAAASDRITSKTTSLRMLRLIDCVRGQEENARRATLMAIGRDIHEQRLPIFVSVEELTIGNGQWCFL